MKRFALVLSCLALLVGACGGSGESPGGSTSPERESAAESSSPERDTAASGGSGAGAQQSRPRVTRVDPRKGGLEIGLGEWALTPEASVVRPGPTTFVIHNRGTMGHGFEIELEDESGQEIKSESALLSPGQSTRLKLTLPEGLYKIECLVDGHDDMGMEAMFEVRRGAPLVKVESGGGSDDSASISDFAFSPGTLEVDAGTKVTWSNDDPAPHTVTASGGEFDSGTLDPGASFSFRFDNPGTYQYRCDIHPDMKGTISVR